MNQCNFQGQISKYLLMFKIEKNNSNEIHVYIKEIVPRFSILEFVRITDIKCTDNIEDFIYPESSTSSLIEKYLSKAKTEITKLSLIRHFKIENLIEMLCTWIYCISYIYFCFYNYVMHQLA